MSFKTIETLPFPTPTLYLDSEQKENVNLADLNTTISKISSDSKIAWKAKNSCLEIRNATTGRKITSWNFNRNSSENNVIVAVEEIERDSGQMPFLVIGLESKIGGMIVIYGISCSKVLRAIRINAKVTKLYVVDLNNNQKNKTCLDADDLLKCFDGIIVVGTEGGNVYLVDMRREVCEDAVLSYCKIRNEDNPCHMNVFKINQLDNFARYINNCRKNDEHFAIHLNAVSNSPKDCFVLKDENDEDRIHVNLSEVEISSLYFSPQITSLLIGYNFGAFQIWDLKSFQLLFTSLICNDHLPVTNFAIQEPADDPEARAYLWVGFSHDLLYHDTFPYTVLFMLCYESKICIDNKYNYLYNDFRNCIHKYAISMKDIQFSMEGFDIKGGSLITFQSLNVAPTIKDLHPLSLCLIAFQLWNRHNDMLTSILLFDLNQWYKEQLPERLCTGYQNYLSLRHLNNHLLDIKMISNTVDQFIGVQRPEIHFCPSALSYDLLSTTEDSIQRMRIKGNQHHFIETLIAEKHGALVRASIYFDQIEKLGLTPLFWENNNSMEENFDNFQKETILSVALEQKLIHFICDCAGRLSTNPTTDDLHILLNWTFRRGIALKTSCDQFCGPLFDYSGNRIDNNTFTILSNSTSQIKNLCTIYRYVSKNLTTFLTDQEAWHGEQHLLENVVIYYEALLWMINIGLLPESNPKFVSKNCQWALYYPQELTEFYNKRRAEMRLLSHDTFVEMDSLLFIDNLININDDRDNLKKFWQDDYGSGLYPPPSLQSLLRTYLLTGSDSMFKHSLVTYTLLDIVKTLNQNNDRVKDSLLKFPQYFNISHSKIKIIQAFWYLDQGECETAIEIFLAPVIANADISQWQHSVILRALLLQKEYNLAFLYIQVRKPSIEQDKDLFTIISLLVSKNMIDEAFTFQQQNMSKLSLLQHIFSECNKNGKLHSLLYRCFDGGEEATFFKYLQNTQIPNFEDLKTFYFLLRSRFLEAFELYGSARKTNPGHLGLNGQKLSTVTDSIVKMFRTLLPDINRNLVEIVHKEKTNLWKPVQKSTPLSVFVHNTKSQPQYKSSIIFAALAKAKETDNNNTQLDDAVRQNCSASIVTEETPFLRTPNIFKRGRKTETRIITTKVIEQNEFSEEFGPSSPKKRRLTSHSNHNKSNLAAKEEQLSTPIISRTICIHNKSQSDSVLPHSILKTNLFAEEDAALQSPYRSHLISGYHESLVGHATLNLTPRKSITRTPNKSQQHVQFNDMNSLKTISHDDNDNDDESSTKNNSANEEEFYSPNNSFLLENNEEKVDHKNEKEVEIVESSDQKSQLQSENKNLEEVAEKHTENNKKTAFSPSRRKSYKRLFDEVPIRSSPRLSKKFDQKTDLNSSSSTPKKRKTARRSLTRIAIENSTFTSTSTTKIIESFDSSSLPDDTDNDDSLAEFFKKYDAATPTKPDEDDCQSITSNNEEMDEEQVEFNLESELIEDKEEAEEECQSVSLKYDEKTAESVAPELIEEKEEQNEMNIQENDPYESHTKASLEPELQSNDNDSNISIENNPEIAEQSVEIINAAIEISSSSSTNESIDQIYENLDDSHQQLEDSNSMNLAFAETKDDDQESSSTLSSTSLNLNINEVEDSDTDMPSCRNEDSSRSSIANSLTSRTETELITDDSDHINNSIEGDRDESLDSVKENQESPDDQQRSDGSRVMVEQQDELEQNVGKSGTTEQNDQTVNTPEESLITSTEKYVTVNAPDKKQEPETSVDQKVGDVKESDTDVIPSPKTPRRTNRKSSNNLRIDTPTVDTQTPELRLRTIKKTYKSNRSLLSVSRDATLDHSNRTSETIDLPSIPQDKQILTPANKLQKKLLSQSTQEESTTPELIVRTIKKTYPIRRSKRRSSSVQSNESDISVSSNQSNEVSVDHSTTSETSRGGESLNSTKPVEQSDNDDSFIIGGRVLRKRRYSQSSNDSMKSTRIASFNKPARRLRSVSADATLDHPGQSEKRTSDVVDLPSILQQKQILTPVNKLQKKLLLEELKPSISTSSRASLKTYAETRRLTRRQSSLLNSVKMIGIKEDEPLNLDDGLSCDSNLSTLSDTEPDRRQEKRSTSLPPPQRSSFQRELTPKRNLSNDFTSGIKTRLRSASRESLDNSSRDDGSKVSSNIDQDDEIKKKRTTNASKTTNKRTRKRINSESSFDSNESIKSTSSGKKNSKKNNQSTSILPEIQEEDETEIVAPSTKGYRLRKKN